jgi:RNA polymerase sigma-70 factor (ECF subfamily)
MLFSKPGKDKIRKPDEVLLSEFRSTADPEVLGELYSEYMHLVYGVCLKYLRDRDEAMDAVMQIFEKLMTEIPKHHVENFRSWLHVLTKNFCLMQLRSKKANDEKQNEWINDQVIFMENEPFLHPVDESRDDFEAGLKDCIEKLKKEQQECIRQFYYGDKCYAEIAASLNIDEKQVKSYLQNAKRNLKICLEEKNAGQE